MRNLHAKFHDAFIQTCLKHFDSPYEQSNYAIEIPFGNTFITFYVDYSVENYNYDESTNSADYDREVYVSGYDLPVNYNFRYLDNIGSFIFKNYYLETLKL